MFIYFTSCPEQYTSPELAMYRATVIVSFLLCPQVCFTTECLAWTMTTTTALDNKEAAEPSNSSTLRGLSWLQGFQTWWERTGHTFATRNALNFFTVFSYIDGSCFTATVGNGCRSQNLSSCASRALDTVPAAFCFLMPPKRTSTASNTPSLVLVAASWTGSTWNWCSRSLKVSRRTCFANKGGTCDPSWRRIKILFWGI